jgi:hypothetical protein
MTFVSNELGHSLDHGLFCQSNHISDTCDYWDLKQKTNFFPTPIAHDLST